MYYKAIQEYKNKQTSIFCVLGKIPLTIKNLFLKTKKMITKSIKKENEFEKPLL